MSKKSDTEKSLIVIPKDEISRDIAGLSDIFEELNAEIESIPDLQELSIRNYEKFKQNLLPRYFNEDEEEVQEFFDIKRKEFILKFSTVLDMLLQSMTDPQKYKKASLRDLIGSSKAVIEILQAMSTPRENTKGDADESGTTPDKMTKEELDARINSLKQALEIKTTSNEEAIEVEFSREEDEEADIF